MVKVNNLNKTQVISLSGVVNALTIPAIAGQVISYDMKNVIFNLSDVHQLDSAGIAWIVRILKQVRDYGGKAIMIWSKSDAANRIIRFTQFDKIFPVVNDIDTAIQLV